MGIIGKIIVVSAVVATVLMAASSVLGGLSPY